MKTLLRSIAFAAGSLLATASLGQATVADARLGKGIVDREIADETAEFTAGERAYLWLRVEGAAGQTITVTWSNGSDEYPVHLEIGGSPWRTNSSKLLHTAGDWTVTVTDHEGRPLRELKLTAN